MEYKCLDLKHPEGLPIFSNKFKKLQYILYHGINKEELEFRQIFVNNLIRDFEENEGELTREQKGNVITQVEEELFENFEHLKSMEDVLENLESEYGFSKKFKKEISLDWVDKETQKARKMYIMNSPMEIKDQRQFLTKEFQNHKKFINIGNSIRNELICRF